MHVLVSQQDLCGMAQVMMAVQLNLTSASPGSSWGPNMRSWDYACSRHADAIQKRFTGVSMVAQGLSL